MSAVPRVSVILPTFNSGAYLEAAVDSILNQTMRDLQFVIVEDGSTDGTAERLAAYAASDPRILLIAEGHHGISGAQNLGIARASAPLIAIMNHDDIARPERLAKQADFLDANPDIVAVGAAMQIIDENGTPYTFANYATDDQTMWAHLTGGAQPMGHPTLMARREPVMQLGGYRDYFAYAEDYDLLLRLAERYKLANLPDVLLDYRAFVGNSTTKYRPEQELAARLGLLASRERREGRPDPTVGLKRADVSHLSLFRATRQEKALIYRMLLEAALWAGSATNSRARLDEAERYLFAALAHGEANLDGNRDRLAEALRTAGDIRAADRLLQRYDMTRRSLPLRNRLAKLGPRPSNRREEAESLRWLVHATHGSEESRTTTLPAPHLTEAFLVAQARKHQVLRHLQRNFPPFADDTRTYFRAREVAAVQARNLGGMTAMLRRIAVTIEDRIAGLPAGVIKGPKFAALYPEPDLRSYTDIDILAAPSALEAVNGHLRALGFELAEAVEANREWKWLMVRNQSIMVEVQTDLVRLPRQRQAVSVTYTALDGVIDRPAAHLLIACVHGSVHQFDRLRQVLDVRHAADAVVSAGEEDLFLQLVQRTGALLAAHAALRLCARLYRHEASRALAGRLPLHPLSPLASALLSPRLVMTARLLDTSERAWQRKVYWRLLTVGRHPSPLSPEPEFQT